MNLSPLAALSMQAEFCRRDGDLDGLETVERRMLALVRQTESNGKVLGDHLVKIALTLNLRGNSIEAERHAREGLLLRSQHYPANSWQVASAQSALGVSLVGLKRYDEAEPILESAYRGLKEMSEAIPQKYRIRVFETVLALKCVYERSSRSEKSIEIQNDLERIVSHW